MPAPRAPIIALALISALPALAQAPPSSTISRPAAQAEIQAEAQTGAQTGAQPGVQAGSQSAPQPAAQTGTQTGILPPGSSPLQPLGGASPYTIEPLVNNPTITPGALTLLELDGRLGESVAKGGGKAFATWFAPDAVTLNNGQPPVQGRTNIAGTATWSAADYQLTWSPHGASMGPSNDMGYTWGSYEGHSKDRNGQPVTTTGRYITIWRKQADGSWKIALEASANDAPGAATCCKLPTP